MYEETLPSGEKLTDVINRTNVRTLFISLPLNVQFVSNEYCYYYYDCTKKEFEHLCLFFGRKMSNIFLESNWAKMLLLIQTLKMQV